MKMQSLRPSPSALLNPRCDAIFKALFTDNSDEGRLALKSFLEAVLETKVSNIRLIQNEISIESEHDKQAIFDIACTINNNEAANIEMQGIDIYSSYDKRAEYNAAHLLNHCAQKGTEWQDVPKVFQISVLNFIYDTSTTQAFSVYKMQTDDNRRLSERMSIIFIELPKIAKHITDDVKNLTAAEKWGKFLLYADDNSKQDFIKRLCSTEEGIMAAQGILSKISQDDINWAREFSHEKWVSREKTLLRGLRDAKKEILEQGLKEGIEQGLKQGLEQGVQQGVQQGRAESQAEIDALKARLAKYETV